MNRRHASDDATRTVLVVGIIILLISSMAFSSDVLPEDPRLLQAMVRMLQSSIKSRDVEIAKLAAEITKLKKDAAEPFRKQLEKLQADNVLLAERIAAAEDAGILLVRQNASLKEALALLAAKDGTNYLPFTGAEISLTKVKADQTAFLGKPFITIGACTVENYYNFRYGNAKSTHFSFSLQECLSDASYTGESMDLYAERTVENKVLVEEIAAVVAKGFTARYIRVAVVMLPGRYSKDGSGVSAELIDWQTLDKKTNAWGPWHGPMKKIEADAKQVKTK